jgi:tetratricopeptide (TPR) repeat protein
MGRIARFALAALLLASIPLAARCQNQPQPSPDLERIIETSSGTPPDSSLRQIDAYVALHPADGVGFAVRCLLYEETALSQGRDASPAFADCEKAVQLSPQAPLVYLFVGDALYDQGHFAESLANYTKAVNLGQTDRGMFWKRCDAYRRVGNLDMALLDCDRQLALTPNTFYALYTRGRLEVARKQYAESLKDLAQVLAIHQDINALYWSGVANLEIGNYQSADRTLLRASDSAIAHPTRTSIAGRLESNSVGRPMPSPIFNRLQAGTVLPVTRPAPRPRKRRLTRRQGHLLRPHQTIRPAQRAQGSRSTTSPSATRK